MTRIASLPCSATEQLVHGTTTLARVFEAAQVELNDMRRR